MKKILYTTIFAGLSLAGFAQAPEDALRYSWNVQGGTARNQAIGGAMGSLGGDITATFVNPAGLGFFRTGDIVLSPNYSFGKSSGSYLGRRSDSSTNKFAIGTSGIIFSPSDKGNSRNVAVSIAINQMADFKNNIFYRGANNQSSYSQTFLEEINRGNIKDGNVVASGFPFGTSLAFNTYWIDTVGGGTNGNFSFQSRAPINTGLLQQNTIVSKGGITELALGAGVNLNDKVMVGGTIGIPFLNHERTTEFIEADATTNANNKFNYAMFTQGLKTSGIGINLKGGVIYKPQEFWRLGFAFHSPTVYSLTDENSAEITTDTEGYAGVQTQKLEDVTGTSSQFKYMHTTPLKLMTSVSYVLREIQDVTRQRGFITADAEYVFYPMSSYFVDEENGAADADTKAYLRSLNETIGNVYKGAFNFRAGGELKFNTVMVRAGAAYYGNPYKNIHEEKGSRISLSGGLGYRHKGMFIDATYVHMITKDVNVPYRLQNAPYYNADIRNTNGKIFLTVGFKI